MSGYPKEFKNLPQRTAPKETAPKETMPKQTTPKEIAPRQTPGKTFTFGPCPSGPWYEWPLMANGDTVYEGHGAPGESNPARLIFTYTGGQEAFCGVITHGGGAERGQFVTCT